MKNRAGVIRGSAFIRGSALVLGSTLLWHASNFAFNALSARMLGTAQYGTLAAVIALLYVGSPIFFSIQTVASRLTTKLVASGEEARIRGLIRFYGLRLGLGGLLLAAAVAISSSALARFLRVPSPVPIAILAIAVLLSVLTHLQRGVLQGSMEFGRYALSTVTEATAKIGASVLILVVLWRSVDAAVLAMALGSALGLFVNSFLLRFLPQSRGRPRPIPHPYRYSALTLSCLLLLAVLLSMDLLASKRYLDPHTAGIYAAVSLSGKIVFFATSALAVYLFPIFSERRDRGVDAKGTLTGALAVLLLGSASLVAGYFFMPHVLITLLFGHSYDSATAYVGWMAIAFSAYAFLYLTAIYLLSQENIIVSLVLGIAALGQAAGLYTFHSTISAIVGVQVVVFVSTAVALGTVALQTRTVASTAPEPA
jgi:O-antigen/teichoic acid export membrane protein